MYRIALVSRSKSNVPVTRNWRNIGKSTSCFRTLSSSGSNRTSNNSSSSSQKCCILSSVNKFDNTTSIRRRYFSTQTEIKPFLLADIGEGIAEVEILQWFVKEGDKVKAGEAIALAGDTGGQSRPSLYFEIRRNSQAQNPKSWLVR